MRAPRFEITSLHGKHQVVVIARQESASIRRTLHPGIVRLGATADFRHALLDSR